MVKKKGGGALSSLFTKNTLYRSQFMRRTISKIQNPYLPNIGPDNIAVRLKAERSNPKKYCSV
jgi:hypothetical protein